MLFGLGEFVGGDAVVAEVGDGGAEEAFDFGDGLAVEDGGEWRRWCRHLRGPWS